MIKLIERKIKELYGSKASFCKERGYKPKDFASKLSTVENKVEWLKQFLGPLDLDVEINKKSLPTNIVVSSLQKENEELKKQIEQMGSVGFDE
jgi:hypothetical protein